MNDLLSQITELGEDVDLLTRHDDWLENQRIATATELNKHANDLRTLLLAQRIKRGLQQNNLVAVQELVRNSSGEVIDITIRIMNLPDALQRLWAPVDVFDEINVTGQVYGWTVDGYDVTTSLQLRDLIPNKAKL